MARALVKGRFGDTVEAPPSPLAGEGVVPKGRRMRGAPQGALRRLYLLPKIGPNVRRQRGVDTLDGQFGRADDEIVWQTQDEEALTRQPSVTPEIVRLALSWEMAGTIHFNCQPHLETDEVDDEAAQYDLSLKLEAGASSIADGSPDKRLGGHGIRALLARKATHGRAGNVVGHEASLASTNAEARTLRPVRNVSARCSAPSSVTLRVTPSPARGEGAPDD
jgi:hypothetical protein